MLGKTNKYINFIINFAKTKKNVNYLIDFAKENSSKYPEIKERTNFFKHNTLLNSRCC